MGSDDAGQVLLVEAGFCLLGSSFHSKKYVLHINSYSSTLQQPEGAGRGG